MVNARDIALIFLSIEALVMALVPLAVLAGLVYGVYWLRGKVTEGLHIAQQYAQKLYVTVEKASVTVTKPFIKVHTTVRMIGVMFQVISHKV